MYWLFDHFGIDVLTILDNWTIIGYLPEHELQEIDFLPGRTAFGKRYCFSIVSEAAQGVGLSLLSTGGAISEKRSKIAVE